MLEQLERANLFLVSLDAERRWYRYHALFAEAMRDEALRRLGADHVRALHARAGSWYAANGLRAQAVEALLAAREFARAAALIDEMAGRDEMTYEVRTIRRWVEQIPGELLPGHPALCLAYAMAILFTEDRGAPATMRLLEGPLELAERVWLAAGDRPRLGAALAFRAMVARWQGDGAESARAARHALTQLPADDHQWRGISLIHLAMDALEGGRPDAAERLALASGAHFESCRNDYGARAAAIVLAMSAAQRGDLAQAEQLYQQVRAEAREDRLDQGHAMVGLAELAYARGDLAAAEGWLAQALDVAAESAADAGERMVEAELFVPASLIQARLLRARGELEKSRGVLAMLAARALRHGGERARREVRAEQARLALALGDLLAVQRWSSAAAKSGGNVARLQQEREALIMARWLVARGEPDLALRALAHWQAEAQAAGRVPSEIEMAAVSAVAHAAAGQLPRAIEALLAALPRARAIGLQRAFLDEGAPMAALLEQAVAPLAQDDPLRGYVEQLQATFPRTEGRGLRTEVGEDFFSGHSPQSSGPAEPLSPQEQRVLRLLGAGLSNPEIAEELVVSVNTVKTHLQSIYRKLGVRSRREARALARGRHPAVRQDQ